MFSLVPAAAEAVSTEEVGEAPVARPQSGLSLAFRRRSQSADLQISPDTLIVGDFIIRRVHLSNATTHGFPGATVSGILVELLDLLPSLPASITRIIVHAGTNDTKHRASELCKSSFNLLMNVLQHCRRQVFISGPVPSLRRGDKRFSRLLSLHTWLQYRCSFYDIDYVNNFDRFWNRPYLFERDGLHLSKRGTWALLRNIKVTLSHDTGRLGS